MILKVMIPIHRTCSLRRGTFIGLDNMKQGWSFQISEEYHGKIITILA